MTGPPLERCLDNDVVLKAVAYGLSDAFWPSLFARLGVLGQARFVIARRLSRLARHQPDGFSHGQ